MLLIVDMYALYHLLENKIVNPIPGLDRIPPETVACRTERRNISVSWNASATPCISEYILNCTNGACISVVTKDTSVLVDVLCGMEQIVNVYTVNCCGFESTGVSGIVFCDISPPCGSKQKGNNYSSIITLHACVKRVK